MKKQRDTETEGATDMKLWLLEQRNFDYDEMAGIVIRANHESEARHEASKHAGSEGWGVWCDPAHTTCERLTEEGSLGFILRDFRTA
jgi:hypothetical protein